ncbi:hypothetical protein WA158_003849 [Blastocystis sp. Blastoise]
MSDLFYCQELIDDQFIEETKTFDDSEHRAAIAYAASMDISDETMGISYIPDSSYASSVQYDNDFISYREQVYVWLTDFADDRKTSPSVVYMAMNYFDRVLSCKKILKDQLEIVGLLCFYLASELIERIRDHFSYDKVLQFFTNRVSSEDIRQLLNEILSILGFRLNCSSPFYYLHEIILENHIEELEPYAEQVLKFICKSYSSIGILPTYLAYSAYYISYYKATDKQFPSLKTINIIVPLHTFYQIVTICRLNQLINFIEANDLCSKAELNISLFKSQTYNDIDQLKDSPISVLCREIL